VSVNLFAVLLPCLDLDPPASILFLRQQKLSWSGYICLTLPHQITL